LLEVLGAFGLDTALIRQTDATPKHFDAVWTFNVLFGLAVGLVAASLAPAAGWLYDDARLVPVILVLAASRAIGGFENTGVIGFRRDLRFDREVAFLLAKRFATSMLVTIPLAFALRSYWALLIGTLAGTCIGLALSYAFHPYRPRFSFAGLPQLMHFSKWIFASSLLEFLNGRFADFIIGRWAGAPALGTFTAAREISRMPSSEVAAPVNRAVFPGYVQLVDDRDKLRRTYLEITSMLMLLVVPAGVGLCVLSEPAVLILLGDRWTAAIPLIQLLAINGILSVMLSTGHHVNLAVGMSRSTSLILALHVVLSIPMMLVFVPARGAVGAALALLIASIAVAPFNLFLLGKAIVFRARDVFTMLWRPVLGSLAMSAGVLWLRDSLPQPSGLSTQIANAGLLVCIGAVLYGVVVAAAWSLRRDPDSPEAWLLQRMRGFVGATGARIFTRSR